MYKLTQKKRKSLNEEIEFQYSRSSGPGGQKVNKTETQVEIHWNVNNSSVFSADNKARILEKLKNRINKEGELVVQTDKFRTRPQNQKLCFQILCEHIEQALTRPKQRKKTKPSRSSIEKRISDKKKHGEKKRNRQKW